MYKVDQKPTIYHIRIYVCDQKRMVQGCAGISVTLHNLYSVYSLTHSSMVTDWLLPQSDFDFQALPGIDLSFL